MAPSDIRIAAGGVSGGEEAPPDPEPEGMLVARVEAVLAVLPGS